MSIDLINKETEIKEHKYQLEFFGKGSEYFIILIVNWLLTLITLGLYYPWARAKSLRYIYGQTGLNNERFHFSGTGKEMFLGFIKVLLAYVGIIIIYMFISFIHAGLAVILLYLVTIAIMPFVIHGSLRYRMSRTSYRSIRFGYRGNRNMFVKKFFKWVFFTIITFGIYSFWLSMNIRRYTHKNIRYGDVRLSNECNGFDYLIIILKGYLLSIITLGIYFFAWQRDIFNYYFNNLNMHKGEQTITCSSTATGLDFFILLAGNLLIVVFTLGLGIAWADIRTQKFVCDHVKMKGNINIDDIHQTEEEYKDALGEDSMEFLDIEI